MNIKYSGYINLLAQALHFPTLDIIDLIIFDVIKDFAKSKSIVDGKSFFSIDRDLIVQQLPILRITTPQNVGLRLKKLCDSGLLGTNKPPKQGQKAYYCFGKKYHLYMVPTKQIDVKSDPEQDADGIENDTEKESDLHDPQSWEDIEDWSSEKEAWSANVDRLIKKNLALTAQNN